MVNKASALETLVCGEVYLDIYFFLEKPYQTVHFGLSSSVKYGEGYLTK